MTTKDQAEKVAESLLEEPRRAIDEERRLCYVGVTRAQRRLTLTLSLSRLKWGKARPTTPAAHCPHWQRGQNALMI